MSEITRDVAAAGVDRVNIAVFEFAEVRAEPHQRLVVEGLATKAQHQMVQPSSLDCVDRVATGSAPRSSAGAPSRHSNCMLIVSATNAGRAAPSTSTELSEVMRTPPLSTGSTDLILWRNRMRDPAATWPVKRMRFDP